MRHHDRLHSAHHSIDIQCRKQKLLQMKPTFSLSLWIRQIEIVFAGHCVVPIYPFHPVERQQKRN